MGGAGGREGRRYLYSRPRNRRGVEQHLGSVLTKGGPCTRSGVLPAATAQFRAVVALRGGLAGGGARRGHTSRVAPRVRRREAAGNGAQRQGLGPAQEARRHVPNPRRPSRPCRAAARLAARARRGGALGRGALDRPRAGGAPPAAAGGAPRPAAAAVGRARGGGVLLAATAQYGAVVALRGGPAGGGARQGRTSHSAPAPRSGGCWSAELGALSPPTSRPLWGR